MHEVLFYLFAALTLLPAILLVVGRNTVNSAMLMIVSFVGTASLFALMGAFLLTVLQVIVYVGAVVVLFVFIIMMVGMGKPRLIKSDMGNIVAAIVFFVLLAGLPLLAIVSGRGGADLTGADVAPASSMSNFGLLLFTKYQLPFEIVGFLLLAAMLGVIFISRKEPPAEGNSKSASAKEDR